MEDAGSNLSSSVRYHQNAQTIYYLRSAGGSWIGVEGRDANMDGVFLDSGLRDVSFMEFVGSHARTIIDTIIKFI